ncbi:MAG: hypothetical protein AB6733_10090 [Clostridiaceae bacterium]
MNKISSKELNYVTKQKKVSNLKTDKNKNKKCIKMIDYFAF